MKLEFLLTAVLTTESSNYSELDIAGFCGRAL